MREKQESLTGLGPFLEIMNKQAKTADQKRLAAIKAEWEKYGEIRNRQLLLRIGYSSPDFFQSLVDAHPARKHQLHLENIQRAFEILQASRSALIDIAGKFHARVEHNTKRKDEWDTTLNDATREVYTYSCAASSLVQAYRHLLSAWPEIKDSYEKLKTQIIQPSGVIAFISELRRSNNHFEIVKASPSYSITNRGKGDREVKSSISFDRKAILESRDWNTKAKQFVKDRESLEVLSLVDDHFAVASDFKRLFIHRTGIRNDRSFRDLQKIAHAREVIGRRVWLNVVLQQALAANLNPYEYLESWFTEEELKNIYSFGDHTKEQLEYMIGLRDPFGFCDFHTRRDLYQLFAIPLDQMPNQEPEPPTVDF